MDNTPVRLYALEPGDIFSIPKRTYWNMVTAGKRQDLELLMKTEFIEKKVIWFRFKLFDPYTWFPHRFYRLKWIGE